MGDCGDRAVAIGPETSDLVPKVVCLNVPHGVGIEHPDNNVAIVHDFLLSFFLSVCIIAKIFISVYR